ncbi:23S rRNA m(5)U-1939 methyltransferase [Pseudorhodobacter antarcticus]|uniref:23S rRNA m(5)U-1939 methyltransferase n=1 Tax=Pseudorhodobacter antarcticus TaxID=1077947 RepID=A0A1H8C4Q8_9RHOB|nr:class I SAM-dependent RNA methyltransferase [Pseudorhodobacter antarcticus]SEM89444.1 23S rRNA m(5)U-1939 methyltransferase [Pseudorhodobacter antarcticus]
MILTIEKLGHLGEAMTQGENGPIFVAQMLPGEVVEGDLVGNRLENARILTPSVNRVKPPCVHARSCGGCLMQHANDDFVAEWKTEVVRSALAGQGLAAILRPIRTSPANSRRRATIAGRRTKGGALLGFHARGSDALVAVPNCQLLHPDLMAAFPALEALVITGGSRKTELALTITRSLAGPDVSVTGGKPLDGQLRLELARVAEAHGLSRLSWDAEVVALRASPMQAMGRARVAPPPGAFLQATEAGEADLLAAVMDAVGNAKRITDLFAGSGTFSLPLSEQAEVHAVEGDAAMMAALDKGWRMAEGLKRITTETRDLFRRPLEPDEFKNIQAVVIDPPRAGAEAQTKTLATARVPVIAAVSCNPVTFARDARILIAAGYRLDWVQPIDQFRWSSHVELAARFSL